MARMMSRLTLGLVVLVLTGCASQERTFRYRRSVSLSENAYVFPEKHKGLYYPVTETRR